MDGEMEIVLNNSLNILINIPFCVPQERKSWHEGKWWQTFHFWVSYPCNGRRTAMDVHYTGITSRKHVNPSVIQRESDLKRDWFLPLVFVLFIYRIKSSKETTRSLFWIVWNADVLCWTATEDSTLYHPENTHALKATERAGDSADACGSHSTGCLNQNASFTPAICEFTTDIHYRRSKMICASRKRLFAVAPGQRSTGSGSPRLNQTKHQHWGRSRKHRSQSADKTVSTDRPIAFPMKYYDMLEIAGANSDRRTPTVPDVNGNSASLSVFRVHFLEVTDKLTNPSEYFLGVLIQRLSEF